MKANIPLNTVDFIPSQFLLRKAYLPNLCEKSLTTALQSFANTPHYLIVDESTDPCGRSIYAGLVGKINSEEKPIAIDIAELYDTNHRKIVQFVKCK